MTPTTVLRDEHAIILRGLDVLEAAAGRVEAGHGPSDGWWDEALDWLRAFADRSHHAKEEDLLFPAMVRAGVPSSGGPIEVMLEEHERGRALVRAMAGSVGAARVACAREYVALLRAHIDKENEVLFPMADVVLTREEQAKLEQSFQTVAATLGREVSSMGADAMVEGLRASLEMPRLVGSV